MVGTSWRTQLNNEAIIDAFLYAYKAGQFTLANDIRLANPEINWHPVIQTLDKEEAETAFNLVCDEIRYPTQDNIA